MDEDEFAAHQVLYNYPTQVIATAQATCTWIAANIATTEPFTTTYKTYLDTLKSMTATW
jgi:protein associated with RNAse G/E